MKFKNFQLEAVNKKFPALKDRILPLYQVDVDFRAICEDYYTCISFLKKLRKESVDKRNQIKEYEKALADLEKELQERIEKNKE